MERVSLLYSEKSEEEKKEYIKKFIIEGDVSENLKEIIGTKHVIIKDSHGDLENLYFLTTVVSCLENTHKTLFFEYFIEGDDRSPKEKITQFMVGKNCDIEHVLMIYNVLKDKVEIIPGDFKKYQPKKKQHYKDYIIQRYAMNSDVAKKIKELGLPSISFYGREHCVKRPNIDKGIPDFLPEDSYIVLECLYKGTEREQIYNVAMEISKGKEVVVLSECNIDFPHVFVCMP
jgi:hypothetical protein